MLLALLTAFNFQVKCDPPWEDSSPPGQNAVFPPTGPTDPGSRASLSVIRQLGWVLDQSAYYASDAEEAKVSGQSSALSRVPAPFALGGRQAGGQGPRRVTGRRMGRLEMALCPMPGVIGD